MIIYRKIVIIGLFESEKDKLATKIAKILKLPVFDFDQDSFIQNEVLQQDKWMIHGACFGLLDWINLNPELIIYCRLNRSKSNDRIKIAYLRSIWNQFRLDYQFKSFIRSIKEKKSSIEVVELSTQKQIDFWIKDKITKKYVYKAYEEIYPNLFELEKSRILNTKVEVLSIEHVGSTAVPSMGGKGIIDLAVLIHPSKMKETVSIFETLGYEFRENFSTEDRFYFVGYFEDSFGVIRTYHLHLIRTGSFIWNEMIGFRDFLRNDPSARLEYAAIKKLACDTAEQSQDKYQKVKEPFIKKINSLLNK